MSCVRRILNVPIVRNAVISGTCMDLELLTGRRYSTTLAKTIIELSQEVRRLVSQLPVNKYGNVDTQQQPPSPGRLFAVDHGVVPEPAVDESAYVEDDLLFSVMHLVKASSINLSTGCIPLSPFDTASGTFGPFTPPIFLQRLQSLHLWGRSCPYQKQTPALDAQAAQHLSVLEYLVSLKGGIRNIKTPGFAEG